MLHPFVKRFHEIGKDDEPLCVKDINIPLNDNQKFEIKKYKEELYKYVKKRSKELRRERRMLTYYMKYSGYNW